MQTNLVKEINHSLQILRVLCTAARALSLKGQQIHCAPIGSHSPHLSKAPAPAWSVLFCSHHRVLLVPCTLYAPPPLRSLVCHAFSLRLFVTFLSFLCNAPPSSFQHAFIKLLLCTYPGPWATHSLQPRQPTELSGMMETVRSALPRMAAADPVGPTEPLKRGRSNRGPFQLYLLIIDFNCHPDTQFQLLEIFLGGFGTTQTWGWGWAFSSCNAVRSRSRSALPDGRLASRSKSPLGPKGFAYKACKIFH